MCWTLVVVQEILQKKLLILIQKIVAVDISEEAIKKAKNNC